MVTPLGAYPLTLLDRKRNKPSVPYLPEIRGLGIGIFEYSWYAHLQVPYTFLYTYVTSPLSASIRSEFFPSRQNLPSQPDKIRKIFPRLSTVLPIPTYYAYCKIRIQPIAISLAKCLPRYLIHPIIDEVITRCRQNFFFLLEAQSVIAVESTYKKEPKVRVPIASRIQKVETRPRYTYTRFKLLETNSNQNARNFLPG